MQNDNHQDFFEFDENFREFLEKEQSAPSRGGRRGRLTVVVVCAVVIAVVATVLGIFRSDDTALAPNLRQTFPIGSPPPVRRAVPKDAAPPESAANLAKPAAPQGLPAGETARRSAPEKAAGAAAETQEAGTAADRGAPQPAAAGASSGGAGHPAPPPAPSSVHQKSLPPSPPSPTAEAAPRAAAASPETVGQTPPSVPATASTAAAPTPAPTGGLPDLTAEIQSGRLQDAARRFARYLRGHPGRYSISVEVACRPGTVVRAFREVKAAGKMFILPMKLDGRDCYAVLWGVYATIGQARAAKASVPPFFTDQATPRVVGLFRYLEIR